MADLIRAEGAHCRRRGKDRRAREESGELRNEQAAGRLSAQSAYPTGGRVITTADLETRYRAYLDALNERRLDDLVHYVQDELSYNGEAMTRRQYQDLIAADLTAIPDLIYDAQIVVASGDYVACRLVFDCTPQHEFLGFSPNGERICFAEHAFYHFRDGRIAAVSSLIDRPAVEAQLRPEATNDLVGYANKESV